jgi:hypothetical protein
MSAPLRDPRLDEDEDDGEEEQEVGSSHVSTVGDSRLAALVNEITLDACRLRLALLPGISTEAAEEIGPLLTAMYEDLDRLPTDRKVGRRIGFK